MSAAVSMSPGAFLARVIDPGLEWVATHGAVLQGRPSARVFLLAVALQESGLQHRAQVVQGNSAAAGPARGWWQFELGTAASRGGVHGIYLHPITRERLRACCDAAWVRFEPDDIWRAVEGHDLLACALARLLLLTDPYPIPVNADDAWRAYAGRLWRPSKPHPQAWPENWRAAQAAVESG